MMEKQKHTPGPWRIGNPSIANGVQIFKDSDWPLRSEVICTMPESGKDRTANAALIASAPTLQTKIDRLEAENKHLKDAAANVWNATVETVGVDDDRIKELEAEKAELVEACKASLKAFRAIYDKMEDEQSAHSAHGVCQELLDEEGYWPLSKLRAAIYLNKPC